MINIIFRSFVILIVLFLFVKILGKKQISEMNLFDYVIGITIGSIAADVSLDLEKSLLAGIASLGVYLLMGLFVSFISSRNTSIRTFINGSPIILIENNSIIYEGLKKAKIDVNDLLSEARLKGYFNLEEINYAVMETNGEISFQVKSCNKPLTKGDYSLNVKREGLCANIIVDGKLLIDNLLMMGKDKAWLNQTIKTKGYKNYDNILLLTMDFNDKVIIYDKDKKDVKNVIK